MKISTAYKIVLSIKIVFILLAIWIWLIYTARSVFSLIGMIVVAGFIGMLLGTLVVLPFTKLPEPNEAEAEGYMAKAMDYLRKAQASMKPIGAAKEEEMPADASLMPHSEGVTM